MKSSEPKKEPQVVQLKDLPKHDRRRAVRGAILRVLLGIVILFAIYCAAPLENGYGIHPVAILLLMLVIFAILIYFSVRRILHDNFPQLRAVQVAILTVTFYLFAFSALYLSMSVLDPQQFTEPLSHVSAFYFTVTVASTVGFGDITPNDDPARIIVTAQMLVNIALIGVGVRAILAIGKARVDRAHRPDTDPLPEDVG